MKTYQQLWQSLTPLYEAGEAQAVIRTVLEVRMGLSFTDIVCGKMATLSFGEWDELEGMAARLQQGEPVQYVLGEADFADRTFRVGPGVLIPRPETAELCQWMVRDAAASPRPPQVLDLCTGSGCIAVTLALELPQATVTGWDISQDALRMATANAERHGMTGRVTIEYGDALQLSAEPARWDLIVSNPPYICEQERGEMARNVLDYEPSLALFVPDDDPLRFYRAIAHYAVESLKPGGALYFEINPLYAEEMRQMLSRLPFTEIELREDDYGKQRMMKATL